MKYHGEFKIKIFGRVVEVKVTGAWNADTAKKYVEDFKTLTSGLKKSPWGVIIDVKEWELGTPDTDKPIADLQIWSAKNNQRYKAVIVGESELKIYQINNYYKNLDVGIIDQRFFCSHEQAIDWFSEVGLYKI